MKTEIGKGGGQDRAGIAARGELQVWEMKRAKKRGGIKRNRDACVIGRALVQPRRE